MPLAHERCRGRLIAAVVAFAACGWLGCAQFVFAVVERAGKVHDFGLPRVSYEVAGRLVVEHDRAVAPRIHKAVHPVVEAGRPGDVRQGLRHLDFGCGDRERPHAHDRRLARAVHMLCAVGVKGGGRARHVVVQQPEQRVHAIIGHERAPRPDVQVAAAPLRRRGWRCWWRRGGMR
eukprot:scaffold123162_cov66-Phaeocystis_antarctica.AAC.6